MSEGNPAAHSELPGIDAGQGWYARCRMGTRVPARAPMASWAGRPVTSPLCKWGKGQGITGKKGNTAMSDIETRDNFTPTIKPHERFLASLKRRAEVEGARLGQDVSQSQMDKILTAETEQEIWDADEGGTFSGQDMEDVELEIQSFTVAPSSEQYDASLGVYINIKATRLDTGEEVIINTGADKIITKLAVFEAKGMLPILAVIKGIPTPNGKMLKLRPVPRRAVSGSVQQ